MPRGSPSIFAQIADTGPVTLEYAIARRGNRYDIVIARSGAANVTRTVTLGGMTADPFRAFVFSSAAGTVRSPGFAVDDVEIQRCP